MNLKAAIFDLDGTLFQADIIAVPAFQATFQKLQSEGLYQGEIPDRDTLCSMFGLILAEIWATLLPDANDDVKKKADQYMEDYEKKFVAEGLAKLYPDTVQVLKTLHSTGTKLFIASNGTRGYVEFVAKAMNIEQYFTGIYSAGKYSTKSKVDLVRILLGEHNLHSSHRNQGDLIVMVGDRSSDIEAGKNNNLLTIACNYGYAKTDSELAKADYQIASIADLIKLSLT